MATYYVFRQGQTDYSDPSCMFKHRHSSKNGKPLAQAAFDKLRSQGVAVRMERWEHDELVKVEQAN